MLAEGKDTACVTGCPTGALKLGEFTGSDEENNQNYPGFPNTGIKPALRLIPLREDIRSPSLQGTGNDGIERYLKVRTYEKREKKISLRSEMALAIFTFLASILIGVFTAQMLSNIQIDHFLFLIAGAAGMGISTSHLGKKFRALKAIMNWKRSWISREIILFSTFLSVGWLYLFSHAESDVLGWFVAIIGFAAAFAMDKVYDIAGRPGWKKMHSGSVLLTALFLTGVFAGNWIMVGWFGFVKLFLYTTRKKYFKATGRNPGVAVSIARIVLSSAIPLVIYQFLGSEYVYLMIASILVGEFIDRCEHYHEFELLTPQVQIDEDLITMVRKNQKTSG